MTSSVSSATGADAIPGDALLGDAAPGNTVVEAAASGSTVPAGPVRGSRAVELAEFLTESLIVIGADLTVKATFGPPGGLLGYGERVGTNLLAHVHPDDLPAALDWTAQCMGSAPGSTVSAVVRLRHADGTVRRCDMTLINLLHHPRYQGLVLRSHLVGPALPPERTAATEFEALFDSLSDAVPAAILVLDLQGRTVFANHAATALLGVALGQLRLGGLGALCRPDSRSRFEEAVADLARRAGRRRLTLELCAEHRAGIPLTVEAVLVARGPTGIARRTPEAAPKRSMSPEPGTGGALVVVLTDVTEQVLREQHLRSLAERDPLTGLVNRTVVERELRRRLRAEASRPTLVFCDLDGFKAVNDRFGHGVGDKVLVAVGQGLRRAAGPSDVVARIGGDEFVVVAMDGGGSGLTERIVTQVAGALAPMAEAQTVTISVGVAVARPGDTVLSLIDRADAAMYARKRSLL